MLKIPVLWWEILEFCLSEVCRFLFAADLGARSMEDQFFGSVRDVMVGRNELSWFVRNWNIYTHTTHVVIWKRKCIVVGSAIIKLLRDKLRKSFIS